MMKLKSLTLCLLCSLLLPSCFLARGNVNEPLPVEAIKSLQPGTTTAKDVVEALGAPGEVVQLGKRSAYRYDYSSSKRAGLLLIIVILFNEDTRQDRVWLFFDENQVLTHVGSTFSGHRTQYSMPWEDIHEEDDRKEADQYRQGL